VESADVPRCFLHNNFRSNVDFSQDTRTWVSIAECRWVTLLYHVTSSSRLRQVVERSAHVKVETRIHVHTYIHVRFLVLSRRIVFSSLPQTVRQSGPKRDVADIVSRRWLTIVYYTLFLGERKGHGNLTCRITLSVALCRVTSCHWTIVSTIVFNLHN